MEKTNLDTYADESAAASAAAVVGDGAHRYFFAEEELQNGVRIRMKYFVYRSEHGLVAGAILNVHFSIDRPARVVWQFLKDFNLWQNSFSHYYTGVIGELEGQTCGVSWSPSDGTPHQYRVVKVIPESLIVVSQPLEQNLGGSTGLPGIGDVDPGFHIVHLNEFARSTDVDILMEHSSLMERKVSGEGMTIDQCLAPWRAEMMVPEWRRKWRDDFVPELMKLIYQKR